MDREGNAGSIKNSDPPNHSPVVQQGHFSKTPRTELTTKVALQKISSPGNTGSHPNQSPGRCGRSQSFSWSQSTTQGTSFCTFVRWSYEMRCIRAFVFVFLIGAGFPPHLSHLFFWFFFSTCLLFYFWLFIVSFSSCLLLSPTILIPP